MFRAINLKSYLPNARPAPKNAPKGPSSANQGGPRTGPAPEVAGPQTSQKRRFDDHAGPFSNDGEASHGSNTGRALKQPRRGRRGRGSDVRNQSNDHQYLMNMPMPPFDPNNPMEALLRMQAMGMPLLSMADAQNWGFPGGRGGRGSRGGRGGPARKSNHGGASTSSHELDGFAAAREGASVYNRLKNMRPAPY